MVCEGSIVISRLIIGWLKHVGSRIVFIIEFISFNARVFSLAIRLFANIMSGHILLKILATAAWGALILWLIVNLLFWYSL